MRLTKTLSASPLVAAVFAAFLWPALNVWPASKYKVLHAFGKGTDGGGLWSSVTLDQQGDLYGAASGGGAYRQGIVFKLTPQAGGTWRESILHSFPAFQDDGQGPNGGLIQDRAGHWYGTTGGGGADHTAGTVFELTHGSGGWAEAILYSFGTQHGDEGQPTAGLVMDSVGNLYGTTETTAFELIPGREAGGWTETVLHRFCSWSNCSDGAGSFAGVVLDEEGNVYGTTEAGGLPCGSSGCGVVYEIEHGPKGWHEKVLHYFDNDGKDGITPGWGALVMDARGNLYGTTAGGGCCGGVVFRLTPQSHGRWKETILYQFQGGALGFEAGAGVVMDNAGNLYGTAIAGGSGCGCGVVYELAPQKNGKWKYTVLHTFVCSDGAQPDANLILDDKGNLYGTTATGGAYGGGVVFELTP